MINDGTFVCSEFPQYEIKWGMLSPISELKIKEWLDDNVRNLCSNVMIEIKDTEKCLSFVQAFVNEVYDQIHQVGYEVGYDSAECDNEGEGL
jgi:hypothetical protein